MNETIGVLGIVFLVTFIAEAVTEYLIGQPFDKIEKLTPYKWLLAYFAAGVGVGLALFYKLDMVALMGKYLGNALKLPAEAAFANQYTAVGSVLTGLLMGRGSNYLHQFISKFFPAK